MPNIMWLSLIPLAAATLGTTAAIILVRRWTKLAVVFLCVFATLLAGGFYWLKSMPLPVPPSEDYIKVIEANGVMRFQAARRSFTNQKTGDKAALVGICHIGEPAYYREIFAELLKYDHILFEGVLPVVESGTDSGSRPAEKDHVAPDYVNMSAALGLESQEEHISPNQTGWIWCDVTTLDIKREMGKRGIDPASMTAGNDAATKDLMTETIKADSLWKILKALKETRLQALALRRYLETKDLHKVKRMLMFASGKEGMDKSMEEILVNFRNKFAFDRIALFLIDPEPQNVAVLYGAAHMPGLERMLLGNGFEPDGDKIWMTIMEY